MANEISVSAILQYTNLPKNIQAVTLEVSNGTKTFNIAGQNYVLATKSFPTTAGGTAIPVGNLGSLGWAIFQNLDSTNYVQLLTAVSGTVFAKIEPLEIALFRIDPSVTAPAILANTAACEVAYLILEN